MSGLSDLDSLRARIEQLERQAEDANQQAEDANRRAEEAEQQAQQDRNQAARDIEAEKQRVEDANQRAEDANQRAEDANRQAEEQQQRTRMTTFEEYLAACHDHLQSALIVETDARFTTKGHTNVKKKYYPKFLRQWVEFPEAQQRCFESIHPFFRKRPVGRFFNSIQFIQELGATLQRRRLASEKDLETYERIAVENAVTAIFEELSKMPETQTELGLRETIEFFNHANPLSDAAEEVQERSYIRALEASLEPSDSSRFKQSPSTPSKPRSQPDQFLAYGRKGEVKRALFAVEYKPPHKLSIGNLQAGFRDMDVGVEVINRHTIPVYTEKPEEVMTTEDIAARQKKLQYNADKLIGAVATQVFDCMLNHGLEFGYLVTGQALVFFQHREDDPHTLYYHLSVPNEEVEVDTQTTLMRTAISQILSFCILSLKSKQRGQAWRIKTKKGLSRAEINWQAVLDNIPESERKKAPLSPAYYNKKILNPKRSPYKFRHAEKDASQPPCDPSDDEDGPATFNQTQGTPSYSQGGSKARGKRASESVDNQSSDKGYDNSQRQVTEEIDLLPYCTQACLLSLVREEMADRGCPNIELHPTVNDYHAIDVSRLATLLQMQLADDPERGCKPLGLQGARGALFRINLLFYGYIFVAKGTVEAFVPDMSHEVMMYQRLEPLQGMVVPIYLGRIVLKHRYYLDLGVKISHMLLLSWGGKEIDGRMTDTNHEIRKTVNEVLRAGIDQMDVRGPNLLWNEERQRIMLIDFERAVTVSPPKRPLRPMSGVVRSCALQDLSPNRRRKFLHSSGMKS